MTAPLSRDKQIEMMTGAPERHAALIGRWMADASVQQIVRQSVDTEYRRHDELLVNYA
ncbi:hypothetical protein ACFHYO_10605 [Paracoccus panacisoli]|uniref:Uncharacterized protein n=1 Tax=Paracoccus panacisoli TaxID=1510163 RepID=A0ABV6T5K9_9RHOB